MIESLVKVRLTQGKCDILKMIFSSVFQLFRCYQWSVFWLKIEWVVNEKSPDAKKIGHDQGLLLQLPALNRSTAPYGCSDHLLKGSSRSSSVHMDV